MQLIFLVVVSQNYHIKFVKSVCKRTGVVLSKHEPLVQNANGRVGAYACNFAFACAFYHIYMLVISILLFRKQFTLASAPLFLRDHRHRYMYTKMDLKLHSFLVYIHNFPVGLKMPVGQSLKIYKSCNLLLWNIGISFIHSFIHLNSLFLGIYKAH